MFTALTTKYPRERWLGGQEQETTRSGRFVHHGGYVACAVCGQQVPGSVSDGVIGSSDEVSAHQLVVLKS